MIVAGILSDNSGPTANDLFTHIRLQHLGDINQAVGPLIVLEDDDQGPAQGERRTVEGMDKSRSLLTGRPVADIEPPCLVVGAIRSAGDLAIFPGLAATRH